MVTTHGPMGGSVKVYENEKKKILLEPLRSSVVFQ